MALRVAAEPWQPGFMPEGAVVPVPETIESGEYKTALSPVVSVRQ